MTPETLVIDRTFKSVGRIKKATGSTLPAMRRNLSRMLTALADSNPPRTDILRAIRDGDLSLLEVYDAYQRRDLDSLPTADTVRLLSVAMGEWIEGLVTEGPSPDCSAKHKGSLETSRRYFERAAPKALLNDLPDVLELLRKTMHDRPRSFNLARSAALAFVRQTLKRSHPLYLAVQAVEMRKVVPTHQPAPLTMPQLRNFFPRPERDAIDAAAWSMALNGMGTTEYYGAWSILADRVHIEGTKREGRRRDVPLLWAPVTPTIHFRTMENGIRERSGRAVSPYDLRRTYANFLEAAGIPRTRRKLYLGHGAGDVTGLYERHEVTAFLASDASKLKTFLELPADTAPLSLDGSVRLPPRPTRRGSRVYFIRSGLSQEIKIGHTLDPVVRLNELQVANSEPLTLMGTIPGGRKRESEIHRLFRHLKIRGEWYRGTRELVSWVERELDKAHTKAHTTHPQPLLKVEHSK